MIEIVDQRVGKINEEVLKALKKMKKRKEVRPSTYMSQTNGNEVFVLIIRWKFGELEYA